jgi:peptidase E
VSGHIVAMGGGGFSMEDSPLLDDYVLGLAGADPRVLFLPTASGDASDYDGEARRRPAYREMVASGALAAGIACDDGAAVHFAGSELLGAVSSRRGAGAYRVEPGAGEAIERPIPTRFLGG